MSREHQGPLPACPAPLFRPLFRPFLRPFPRLLLRSLVRPFARPFVRPFARPFIWPLLCLGLWLYCTGGPFPGPAGAANGPAAPATATPAAPTAPSPAASPAPVLPAAGVLAPVHAEAGPFVRAMEEASALAPSPVPLTGLVLPHGPGSAASLARAFATLGRHPYKRIIILAATPEGRGLTAVLPGRDLGQCFGVSALDRAGAAALFRALPEARPVPAGKRAGKNAPPAPPDEAERQLAGDRFALSSPVQSLLPFLARHAPGALVLPVGVPASTGPRQWDVLLEALRPLAGKDTLVAYAAAPSEGLDPEAALRRDQAFMRLLSAGDPKAARRTASDLVAASGGSLYLMIRLQREAGSRLTVLEHAALREGWAVSGAFAPADLPVPAPAARYFAAGDFFTGRNMAVLLANPTRKELLVNRILERTRGLPLLVNFEGVLMDPDSADPLSRGGKAPLPKGGMRLWMPGESTLALLRELNIVAVSLANNHTYDFGKKAYADTQAALEAAGFPAPGQGEIRELDHFTLAAVTDLDNNQNPYAPILKPADIAPLAGRNPAKPLFVMTHLGNEYIPKPNDRARQVGTMLKNAGAELIIGHHPHVPGPFEATEEAWFAWTLGNFVFDQVGEERSGALLEIVFFPTGAWWVRQLPPENMYRNFHTR